MIKFTNKNFKQKIIIAILIVIISSFFFSSKVQADDGIGGKLLNPVVDLVIALGDGLYSIGHKFIMNQDFTLYRINMDNSLWESVATLVVGALAGLAMVGLTVLTGGLAGLATATGTAFVALITKTAIKVAVVGIVAGYIFNATNFGDEIVLPIYSLAPEYIFNGKIPLFNVDFFNTEWDMANDSGRRKNEVYCELG